MFERAVAVREAALGPDHPDTAKARKWLKKSAREQLAGRGPKEP